MSRFIAGLAIASALAVGICRAQLGTATISGVVTDSSGAAVAGASISAVNSETGFRRQTLSNTLGQYNLPGLAPGGYDLTFEFQGFKKAEQKGLTLQVDQNARIDIGLEVGQITESVEIAGQAPLVESQSATLGAVVDTQKILALPLNGRNFAQLALLVPGVNTGSGGGGAEGFSASGVRADENAFQIDGTSNSDSFAGRITVRPNIDAIQEFKIQTNNYSAEFGKGGGAQVNVITKSGTREFHGGAWEFVRNDALQARRFFDTNRRAFPCDRSDPNLTLRAACAPPFHQNQFGFNLGGPMFLIPTHGGDRKTFFFTTYEGFRQSRGNATQATVPSVAQRNGDFSQNLLTATTVADATGRTFRRGQLFDPNSSRAVTDASGRTRFIRDPFVNNQIPLSRMDPVAVRILGDASFIPLANAAGSVGSNGNPSNNFQDGRSTTSNSDQFSARIDHQFSPNDTLFGRFTWQDSNSYAPNTFPGFGTIDNQRQVNLTGSYTKVLSPSMVNEFRFGYQGWFEVGPVSEDFLAGKDYMTKFNIRGLEYAPKAGLIGSPTFAITGFAGWGNGTGPNYTRNHTIQPLEMLSFNKGKHFMKVGGELRNVIMNERRTDTARGNFAFDTAGWTGIDGVGNTGNELAAFELGLARQKARVLSNFVTPYRFREWGAFFQDDFKVSRNLTINIGMRYMYWTPPYTTDNNYGSFDYKQKCPSYAVCGTNFVNFLTQDSPYVPFHAIAGKDGFPRSLTNTEKNDFGPRFGFAWQPFDKPHTVIRGGYGVFYDTVNANVYGDSLLNYPRVIEQQVNLGLQQNGPPPGEGFLGFLIQNPNLGPGPIAQFEPGPNGFPPDFHNAYIQSWNIGVQRQLPGNMVLEVAYIGTKSTRLQRQEQSNTAEPLGFRSTIPDLSNNVNIPNDIGSGGRNQFRRLVAFTREQGVIVPLGNVFLETSEGFANYNGGTLRFEKRRSNGITFITTYAFSKAISDSPGFGGGGASTGGRIQNVLDRKAEKGLAELDHKQRFTTAFVYDLPFGQGRAFGSSAKGAVDRIIGGWAVEGIFTLQSGPAMTIVRAGDPGSVGTNSALRPDLICNPNRPRGQQTVEKFFKTECYVAPEALIPGDVRYGTAGRSTAVGPGLIGTDFSIRKDTTLAERVRAEFRAEFFNAANHANFSTPNRNLGDGNFGKVTDTADPRIIQLGLKLLF